ncbi:hypothetical protein BX666DRAFT_1932165 [Dichotomocladium elegans]|nr:hypothetical protein BX666DRAFT_1932165 [Dichotomocladium elegans]
MAARLNMHLIIRSLRSQGLIPQQFRRGAIPDTMLREPGRGRRNVRDQRPRPAQPYDQGDNNDIDNDSSGNFYRHDKEFTQ